MNKLTWADFYLAGVIEYLNFMTGTSLLEKYPNLQAVVDGVSNIPAVKAWIEERPKTDA